MLVVVKLPSKENFIRLAANFTTKFIPINMYLKEKIYHTISSKKLITDSENLH